MRFGNGRDGLNIDQGEMTCIARSYSGRGIESSFHTNGSKPAYSQECLLDEQAKCLLISQSDIKRI